MKAVLLLAVLIGNVLATPFVLRNPPMQQISFAKTVHNPSLDTCKLCINFADQFINQLLNIILNVGVVGTCGELCNMLAEKVNSSLVGVVCDLLCDYVGIEAFIKIVEDADLDPIYYCELLRTCPVKDDGDAKILSLTVTPNMVPRGSAFKITLVFQTVNGTGTGEIDLLIETQDGIPVGQNDLSEELKPGQYQAAWNTQAKPDPSCDPTQQPCEEWLPGNYTVHVSICNGECGSKHPHSQVYDTAKATFNVTKS